MDWKSLTTEQLRGEIERLEASSRDIAHELAAAHAEKSARVYGIAIGESVEISGKQYIRVWSAYGLKLRKAGGKAGRYANNWKRWKAGEAATPW